MFRLITTTISIICLLHLNIHVIDSQLHLSPNSAYAETYTPDEGDYSDTDDYTDYDEASSVLSLLPFVYAVIHGKAQAKCLTIIDMWVMTAGMLIYVIWEVVNALNFSQTLQEQELEVEVESTAEATTQIATLESVSEGYQALIERYEQRRDASYTMMGFAIGAIVVWLVMVILYNLPCPGPCTRAAVEPLFVCNKFGSTFPLNPSLINPKNIADIQQLYNFDEQKALNSLLSDNIHYQHELDDNFESLLDQSQNNTDSTLIFNEWKRSRQGAISSQSLSNYDHYRANVDSISSGIDLKEYYQQSMPSNLRQMISMLDGLLPEKAYASDSGISEDLMWQLGLAGGTLALFKILEKTLDKVLGALYKDYARIAPLTIYMGSSLANALVTEEARIKISKRKEGIDNIISQLRGYVGDESINNNSNNDVSTPPTTIFNNQRSAYAKKAATMECKSNKKLCPKPEGSYRAFNTDQLVTLDNQAWDSQLTDFTSDVNTAGTQASAGNGAAAIEAAQNAAQKASKLKNRIPKLKEKLAEIRKKQGQKKLDFNKLQASVVSRIKSAVKKSYNSLTPAQRAEFEKGNSLVPKNLANKGEAVKKQLIASKGKIQGADKDAKEVDFSKLFSDLNEAEKSPDETRLQDDNALDEKYIYPNTGKEIHKTDSSLFKILEIRYRKSAYPRLFVPLKK